MYNLSRFFRRDKVDTRISDAGTLVTIVAVNKTTHPPISRTIQSDGSLKDDLTCWSEEGLFSKKKKKKRLLPY
jgi:hypothetical protein